MKAQLFACVLFLLVAIFALTVSQGISSSTDGNGFGNAVTPFLNRPKKNSKRSPQCRRNVQRSCTSSTMSCGRLGRANICQAFQNDCQRQLANCGGNKATKCKWDLWNFFGLYLRNLFLIYYTYFILTKNYLSYFPFLFSLSQGEPEPLQGHATRSGPSLWQWWQEESQWNYTDY